MALDSSFWIDAPGGPKWVAETLAASDMFTLAIRPNGSLIAPGVSAVVAAAQNGDHSTAGASISASVQVFFANTDKSLTRQWTMTTVRAVVMLLSKCEGDALLLYCSDSPALLRRGGELTLDPRCGLWKQGVEPAVLPLVTMPYSWREIPFD